MTMPNLATKRKALPPKPGIYLFKDASGEVLYVGKAKNLKKRVSSYFYPVSGRPAKGAAPAASGRLTTNGVNPKTAALVAEIADLEYVIVSSELEALMLESNLIKKHLPKFNVRLRDDKNWQYIKIDYESEIPQVYTVRQVPHSEHSDKIRRLGLYYKYFGPYTSGLAVKNTLKLLKRIFHLCTNKKVSTRPCFQYHLGRCPGVCIGKVSVSSYRRALRLVEKFLKNRQSEIVRMLKQQMHVAASAKRFESAATIRDTIRGLQRLWEKQKIISPQKLSEDYLGLYQADRLAIVKLFQVREGRLIGQETFELKTAGDETHVEVLQSFIAQYYPDASDKPRKIISRHNAPSRGKKLGLLKLAEENAKEYFVKNHETPELILLNLKTALGLRAIPRRIEGYDISNLQGTNPVGSMVVFEDATPKKSDYRKFKINLKNTPDDVGMMKELLTRRLQKNNSPQPPLKLRGGEGALWPLPDLIVIDGGRGQLNAALKILTTYNLQLPAIGLAKRLEEICLPNQTKPLVLRHDSPVLQLLQRLRDEAHRFAVTFHSKRRGRESTRSALDEIAGIGPKTKKLLLKTFGSLGAIRQASEEELAKIIGAAKAKQIKENL